MAISNLQRSVLIYMTDYFENNHRYPTYREIAEHLGYKDNNPTHVSYMMKALEREGCVSIRGRKYAGAVVSESGWATVGKKLTLRVDRIVV